MKYVIKTCENGDSEYFAERYDEEVSLIMPPDPSGSDEIFVFKVEDDEGGIIGGCILQADCWMIANISSLWVDERFRRRGMGSALLRTAEHMARKKRCSVAVLGTYDFQARPFYEKHGYKVCGTVSYFPQGHENYSMAKWLLSAESNSGSPVDSSEHAYTVMQGDGDDAEEIGSRLCEYDNSIAAYEYEPEMLRKKAVDEEGNAVGGAMASIDGWNCMQVEFIWVEEMHRNMGIGLRLLGALEREARERGCYIATAGANEWQVPFLKKQGYKTCSLIQDCPEGHSWQLLEKRL